MGKITAVRKATTRWGIALLVFAVAAATLHLQASTALAAQATASWSAPTTYTDGSPLTTLSGYKLFVGTAPGTYSQTINVGNTTSYTVSSLNDATTYYFATQAYDASGNVSAYSNEVNFTTPAAPAPTATYTITASAQTGGTITPSGSIAISQGLSQTFTIAPSTGYQIAAVTVDGASVGAVSSYTFSNVAANHTITASFASTSTASAGTTSSSTWQNQAFTAQSGTFTASFDAVPSAANIDGIAALAAVKVAGFTDCAAMIRFNTSGYIDARNGGSYAAGVSVPYSAGKSYHFRMVANVASHLYDVYVTPAGASEIHLATGYAFRTEQATVTSLSDFGIFSDAGSFQMSNFSMTPQSVYTISASASVGGSITPAGTATVNGGGSQTYTISPSTGYQIAAVTVDGASVGAVSSYTFSNVAANHTITASFASTSTASTSAGTTSSSTWQNQSFTSQTGTFTASFDAVPSAANIDGIAALAAVKVAGFTDCAAMVRFNTSGYIDARNGGSYAAGVSVPYSAGKSYHFRMVANVASHLYDVYVTPAGASEIHLATGYAFRTEQATVTSLSDFGIFSDAGSFSISNFSMTPQSVYTISASASVGGSITPAGTATVNGGGSQTYTITPAAGFKIASVNVDGQSVGAVSSYTFSSVAANHTIAAGFAITSSTTWQNAAMASQSGTFTASFDTIPNSTLMDGVTVLSANPALSFSDGATIVRFNNTGTIDARKGGSYAADVSLPYTAGSSYHVRMTVNVASHVYDVYVTPPGGSEIHLASAYPFRTEQASVSALSNLGVFADSGTHQVANFTITP